MAKNEIKKLQESIEKLVAKSDKSKYKKTKAVLNQAVADLSKAASIIHQTHWYMRGPGFFNLHPEMDELMDSLNADLDVMSERLITIGGSPYSTLKEFDQASNLEETRGAFDLKMKDHLKRLTEVYSYLDQLYQVGLDITSEEGDDPTNDIFTSAKAETEKMIWMLNAELGTKPEVE
ncbi:Dps family protein [Streptococcus parauberis]|uniref:Dps family protein n=1 Tax=Streptococcus parauberis TaxID=1348 RepID=UPI000C1CA046|nr:Dps family protein [Streptococcus parauberis]PIO78572.1 DNA protection during starvation protein [Streptococcus parauberis]POS67390.1 DNA protection during starvation protein [Streptococcus parauberis]